MGQIIFECDVTEYNIIPQLENNKNCFFISDKALLISLCGEDEETFLNQTEISKKDAIELAKLILQKYNAL